MINLNRKPVLVLAALLAVVWLAGVKSLLSRNMALSEEVSSRKNELAHQKGILLRENEFLARFEDIKNRADGGASAEERLTFFIAQAERWSREENLLLHDVRPLPPLRKNDLTFLKVTLELEGEMNLLGRFLHKMLSSGEPVRIERFSFYQKIRARPQINLDMEISLLSVE